MASERTPFGVVRNSSIAYSLQIVTFGLFFSWGAKGEFWPALIFSAMFGSGLYLIYRLRLPMLAFTGQALDHDRSVTVPGFIASQHGDDARVQLLAAVVSVCAFAGMLASAAIAVASLVKPFLPGGLNTTFPVACGVLGLMLLYAIPAGHSGAMRSAQIQLGILYFGLIGSTFIVLYMLLSSAGRMPPRGTFAVAVLAICCSIVLIYRRSRYIDTSPISSSIFGEASAIEPAGAGFNRRVSRVANEVVAVLAGTTLVMALFALYTQGADGAIAESVSALRLEMPMSISGVLALVLLPAFYPIVDTTNWLRIAALDTDAHPAPVKTGRAPETFARVLGMYAGASAMLWLFICVLGTIAVLATGAPDGADILRSFILALGSQQTDLADAASWLLLVSVAAMAVLTGSAMFSAISATLRYDIIPNIHSSHPERAEPADQMLARRRAVIAGGGLCAFTLIAISLLNGDADLSFTTGKFLHMQLACVCAQLAFAPLVLGSLIGGQSAAIGSASAIAVIGTGLVAGQGVIIVSLQTGFEAWLWSAVPACLGLGLAVYAMALVSTKKTSPES